MPEPTVGIPAPGGKPWYAAWLYECPICRCALIGRTALAVHMKWEEDQSARS